MATIKTEKNYIWIARFESRNFDWQGIGRTKDEAMKAIRRTWNKLARDKWGEEEEGDTCCYRFEIGKGYQDWQNDSPNGVYNPRIESRINKV